MSTTRWGIIGPGAIAGNFATGLAECKSGELVAIASRDATRREAFGDRFGVARRYDSYAELCADPEIDAIHIATPHPFHAEQALMVIRAGKGLAVQKPAGLNAAEVTAMVEAAAQEGVLFSEAFMWLCHPQVARLVEILGSGELGTVRHVRASFGFAAGFNPASRLFDPKLGGGGILDVGCYPVSAARMIAGIRSGEHVDPVTVKGSGIVGETGVDEVAYGLLTFADGMTAEIACATRRTMENTVVVECDDGRLTLTNPWTPGREAGPSTTTIIVESGGESRTETIEQPEMLFTFEAEAASRAVAEGRTALDYPRMTPAGSIGNNAVLDAWRAELGVATIAEDPAVIRRLPRTLPAGLPEVPKGKIDGVKSPVSKLVMGCDNRNTIAEGALVWDAWMEAGGNAFDTAFVYGGGKHEAVLGQWIASRGVADDIVVIGKGAHSPYCTPRAIGAQLDISLERLGLDSVPIYIMHRDNTDVPVGEFVEAIAEERAKGRVGIWGGSNWTIPRFREAVAYAEAHGLEPPRILNNNLSLAVMEKPVWAGCVTSNTPDTLAALREGGITHLSWSSQARGYFLPAELRDRLPEDTRPETCYGSDNNAERRRRAEALAAQRGVSAHNIATAWVIAQSFPSFALIGPRSPGEIASTLPGLGLDLSEEEVLWLNLEGPAPASMT